MRNVLLGVLGSALLVAACAAPATGSSGRPNSARAMQSTQQDQPKDPHDYVTDPTIGNAPAQDAGAKPLCHLQCGARTHCDASGFVERCVTDEEQKN